MEGFILTPFFWRRCLRTRSRKPPCGCISRHDGLDGSQKGIEAPRRFDLTVAPPKPSHAGRTHHRASARTGGENTSTKRNSLYEARDFEKAGSAFRKALLQTEQNPLHARVYYGLARIAALKRRSASWRSSSFIRHWNCPRMRIRAHGRKCIWAVWLRRRRRRKKRSSITAQRSPWRAPRKSKAGRRRRFTQDVQVRTVHLRSSE